MRLLRRFKPPSRGQLLLRVKLDRLGPLDMQFAEKRAVPAGERKPGHRGRHADVDADHAGVEVVLELSGRRDAKCRMYRFGIVPKPE
jgi:hypothetical protein